jgi:HK97 family phage prohead protease
VVIVPDKSKIEQRELTISNFEIRAATDNQPTTIIGYAVEWDKLSDPICYFREKFVKGAFSKSLINDDIRALWQHNTSLVLGRTKNNTLKLTEDDTGLRVEITPPNTQWANDAIESIRRGDVSEMSFGFIAIVDEWDWSDPDMAIRTVSEAQLFEVSPITFAAYPQTSVGVRSAENTFSEAKMAYEKAKNESNSLKNDYKLENLRAKMDFLSKRYK